MKLLRKDPLTPLVVAIILLATSMAATLTVWLFFQGYVKEAIVCTITFALVLLSAAFTLLFTLPREDDATGGQEKTYKEE